MNRLQYEKSPYLKQHASNPVDWFPWCEEAFSKALNEDKPIFLSIGYSTCHWCHVMEKESFENQEIAEMLNRVFVPVKVDREERPDIDAIYMYVCEMLTGGGGWPLSVILTPDKKPFFAATYIPAQSIGNQVGMYELIPQIDMLWATQRKTILRSAERFTDALIPFEKASPSDLPELSISDKAIEQLSIQFDKENGGFGPAPKFPNAQAIMFLFRHWKRTSDQNALEMGLSTLKAMRNGGIYDQLGSGFHRYSTDDFWRVPHFEKMLYDQAMMIMAFTEAFQITSDTFYSDTINDIAGFLDRELISQDGAFFSAEDADIKGEEGKFYLWTEDEIKCTLNNEEIPVALAAFGTSSSGNISQNMEYPEPDVNVLYNARDHKTLSELFNIPGSKINDMLNGIRAKLFEARQKRIHPSKDNKILADWNGLTIAALAKASRALKNQSFCMQAEKAANFIIDRMITPEGKLSHVFCEGQKSVQGFCDDYTFMIWGLVELYETTFDVSFLKQALRLSTYLFKHFEDNSGLGGLFTTSNESEELLLRRKEGFDGPYTSGNAIAAYNEFRLAHITADPVHYNRATSIVKAFSGEIIEMPTIYTSLLWSLGFWTGNSKEVVIAGDSNSSETGQLINSIFSLYIPDTTVILRPTETNDPQIIKIANYLKDYKSKGGKTTGYVCMDHTCQSPANDIDEIIDSLRRKA
jgi:uncharacterized protein YyaL (SSP411 family)